MKLYMTPTSPYSRRARIAIHEAGYADNTEEIDVAPVLDNLDTLLQHGPGGKVPTLVTDDGTAISECMVICHYMDDLCGGKLYPKDPAERLACYRIESIGAVLMDSVFTRSGQNRLDPSEQSKTVIDKEIARTKRCYNVLEGMVDEFESKTHMGALSLAAALSYADWRAAADKWREGHPRLDAWMKEIAKRPSMAATARADGT